MTLNYCDIECSWDVEVKGCSGLDSIFRYQLTQCEEISSTEHPAENNEETLSDQYCQLFCDGQEELESDHRSPCVIQLTCKLPYNVSVQSIRVTSESRTQEIYDKDNVYMMTTSPSAVQRTQDDLPLYTTSAIWDTPISGCFVKFLSLGGRESFRVYEVVVVLAQGGECVKEANPLQSTSIDMTKVKQLVGSMGGQLSDRAKSFMTTMEQYQQNKEDTLSDVGKLLAQSSKPPSEMRKSAGDMSQFISMFASMTKLQSQVAPRENGVMSSILSATGPLQGSNGDKPPPMLNFLKDICGQVSKMREIETTKTEKSQDDMVDDEERESSPIAEPVGSMEKLEKTLLKHFEGMEKRLEEKVNSRMRLMEDSVNKKLDRILDILSRSIQTPPDLYESSDESSGTSSGEIALD